MNNSNILRILSPLFFFVIHMIYLIGLSPDPFLKKWIDGSFTFFIALVMCNIIRARIVAKIERDSHSEDAGDDQERPQNNSAP